ncbi:hypothetical protein BC941DRAFT_450483 [Chlamydoabsidia padenii]|nr:hypothetical protein BC941DRAFT_450483 [Chlamydoabsidia padenii]
MSSYISDAAAIKEFYTAICLIDEKELQNRIHKAMDNILSSWTQRHDDMTEALNQLEHSYATLYHEAQAQATLYHKSIRERQFYKSKYDSLAAKFNHPSFDRRSCLSIDSCGRSTVNTHTTSSTDYSRYSKTSYYSHPSDDSYSRFSSFSSSYASSCPPSSVLSFQDPPLLSSPKEENDDPTLGGNKIHYEQEKKDDNDKVGDDHDQDDKFDILSVLDYTYPGHIPSAKPPPTSSLPPPPSPTLSPTSTLPSNKEKSESITPKDLKEKEKTTVTHIMQNDKFQTPTLHSSEELSFACGDGFWSTIAKGKSNKEEVETLIKAGKTRMITLLAHEWGQIPDVADYKGETPLHYAIRHRRTKVVAKLVGELGAYPNAYVVKKVPTPLDMAKSGGLRSIADYLKKMGAKTVKEMEKTSGRSVDLSSSSGTMSFWKDWI